MIEYHRSEWIFYYFCLLYSPNRSIAREFFFFLDTRPFDLLRSCRSYTQYQSAELLKNLDFFKIFGL